MEEQWGGSGSDEAFDGSTGGAFGGFLETMGYLDLRRRRQRVFAERIADRACFLPRADELLLQAVLEEGRRVTEVALAAGVCPRMLRSRVRRLIRRLGTPRFAFVALRMGEWTATRRKVAEACYLHGLSMREAGERHRLTRHQIRFHRDAIEALFQVEVVKQDRRTRTHARAQVRAQAPAQAPAKAQEAA